MWLFINNLYFNIENPYISLYNILNILLVKEEEKLQKSTPFCNISSFLLFRILVRFRFI